MLAGSLYQYTSGPSCYFVSDHTETCANSSFPRLLLSWSIDSYNVYVGVLPLNYSLFYTDLRVEGKSRSVSGTILFICRIQIIRRMPLPDSTLSVLSIHCAHALSIRSSQSQHQGHNGHTISIRRGCLLVEPAREPNKHSQLIPR